MTKRIGSNKREIAFHLRARGESLDEIAKALTISKSTASVLLRNLQLNTAALAILAKKRSASRIKASQALKKLRNTFLNALEASAKITVSHLRPGNKQLHKVLCSLLYWGEGGKTDRCVAFINSDAKMIATFLTLLRQSFILDESKFRALVHIHEYHNEQEIKLYWSKITNIPLQQFTKSYLKPHTGRVKRPGFKGTLKVKYYNVKIAYELKAIYNTLADSIGT